MNNDNRVVLFFIMKKIDNIEFVRWGNLNPVKHKEGRLPKDSERRTFHTAPVYKGFYAFPKGFIEGFLLGCSCIKSFDAWTRHRYLHDDNGKLIKDDEKFWGYNSETDKVFIKPEYTSLIKKRKLKVKDLTSLTLIEPDDERLENDDNYEYPDRYIAYKTRPHFFEYKGIIWHHLGDHLDEEDILDRSGSWYKSTYKSYIKALKRCFYLERFKAYMEQEKGSRHGDPHSYKHIKFAKDHYEVFIERIK